MFVGKNINFGKRFYGKRNFENSVMGKRHLIDMFCHSLLFVYNMCHGSRSLRDGKGTNKWVTYNIVPCARSIKLIDSNYSFL